MLKKMKINNKQATGIHFAGNDFEYIKSVRKPNVDTKIIYEVWFIGTVKRALKILRRENQNE